MSPDSWSELPVRVSRTGASPERHMTCSSHVLLIKHTLNVMILKTVDRVKYDRKHAGWSFWLIFQNLKFRRAKINSLGCFVINHNLCYCFYFSRVTLSFAYLGVKAKSCCLFSDACVKPRVLLTCYLPAVKHVSPLSHMSADESWHQLNLDLLAWAYFVFHVRVEVAESLILDVWFVLAGSGWGSGPTGSIRALLMVQTSKRFRERAADVKRPECNRQISCVVLTHNVLYLQLTLN